MSLEAPAGIALSINEKYARLQQMWLAGDEIEDIAKALGYKSVESVHSLASLLKLTAQADVRAAARARRTDLKPKAPRVRQAKPPVLPEPAPALSPQAMAARRARAGRSAGGFRIGNLLPAGQLRLARAAAHEPLTPRFPEPATPPPCPTVDPTASAQTNPPYWPDDSWSRFIAAAAVGIPFTELDETFAGHRGDLSSRQYVKHIDAWRAAHPDLAAPRRPAGAAITAAAEPTA